MRYTVLLITILVLAAGASAAPQRRVWHAGMESGGLEAWTIREGGGFFDSGSASETASKVVAHSGRYSLRAVIRTPPEAAVSAFRWKEPREYAALYYSVWVYFPARYRLTGNRHTGRFWNLLQWKSRNARHPVSSIWQVNLGQTRRGLVPYLAFPGALPGPQEGQSGFHVFHPLVVKPIEPRRWIHFVAYVKAAHDYTGRIAVWQDGAKIFDRRGVVTSFHSPGYNEWNTDIEWSVNCYSDKVVPSPTVLYIDDASISTHFIP